VLISYGPISQLLAFSLPGSGPGMDWRHTTWATVMADTTNVQQQEALAFATRCAQILRDRLSGKARDPIWLRRGTRHVASWL